MAVNLARHLGVDADAALRSSNAKFARRFAHVCRDLERLPPIGDPRRIDEMEARWQDAKRGRKSTRLNSSPLMRISYAVFCLKKKTNQEKRCNTDTHNAPSKHEYEYHHL